MFHSIGTNKINILPQPTDESCGPTCLHAVYNYFDDHVELDTLIDEVHKVKGGGTLAVMLGNHALNRGYSATIYTNNLHVFDPTWFQKGIDISEKLKEQMLHKSSTKIKHASSEYLTFLKAGGKILYKELTPALFKGILNRNIPILTGLSATYLYQNAREIPETNTSDDIKGFPVGHFVVICGFDKENKQALIADPWSPNPIMNNSQYYSVDIQRVIRAIMLGIITYDANILIIEPK